MRVPLVLSQQFDRGHTLGIRQLRLRCDRGLYQSRMMIKAGTFTLTNEMGKLYEALGADMIKYDKLWKTAEKKRITKSMLTKKYNVSKTQLYRLRYNQPVSTNTLDRLCNILECDISDIMEHIPDDNFF